ncbi:POTRA domain-containing FtsQ-type protein [Roseinatronobacter thiooxidans]|uniref:Cell division protein FtsQ n=1 Tax=Roseinatronobacter thiooxidans TaxID=121821 RepID=A0A2W7QUJ7_9RHOB|nr:cell division protein FtsQ/DivIB [Roseinatronobacter thiooxidans]PZX47367.1 POTRA domain-containing FtsQ-type protein [Roseinatronobacter thiooxidans]
MRPVAPEFARDMRHAPAETMPQDLDAPLSALSRRESFWDHLSATRAEEYAQEDIFPHVLLPDMVPDPHAAHHLETAPYQALDMSEIQTASLVDTLGAPSVQGALDTDALSGRAAFLADAPVAPFGTAAWQDPQDAPVAPETPFFAGLEHRPHPKRKRISPVRDSRLAYRLQRMWLTPGYRAFIKYGAPVLAVLAVVTVFFADEARRAAVAGHLDAVYDAFVDRPEFMVTSLQLPEMSPELDNALRQKLDIDLPQSSFRIDLDAVRQEVETLDWVRSVDVRLLSGGVIALSVTERTPAILWRSEDGLELLDGEGVRVAFVAHRNLRADLPLIAGKGADLQIPEALQLIDAAAPLGHRLRGLMRMGERRWDVVLDRDQRIRLPETGAVAALERVIALEQAQDLLSRDLLVADMRNPSRPILQISAGAMDTLRDIRSQTMEALQ